MAAKAALCNTSLPNIVGTYEDGKNIDLQISDDPFDTKPLDARNLSVLVSLCKIGNNYVVDPTIEEEICGAGCIVVSVTPKGNITAVLKKGAGSFMPDTLNEIITVKIIIIKLMCFLIKIKYYVSIIEILLFLVWFSYWYFVEQST